MQPILLSPISTDTLDEKTWLEWREHGPDGNIKWTIGGSDVASILNISPWNTSLELYERKKGIKPAIEVEYNKKNKEIGHLNEAHIARLFEADLKEKYPDKDIKLYFDKHMYQCGDRNEDGSLKYPWMVVNYDAFIVIDGVMYLVEIKTTSPRGRDNIEKWKEGKCPEYYECQCRYYMKALDVNGIFIVCAWDFQPLGEGRNYVFIERDKEAENYIINACENFIEHLENDITPDLWDVNSILLRNYYERLYGPCEIEEEFEIPLEYKEVIESYMDFEERIAKKKKEIEAYQKEQDGCLVRLLPLFENRQKGKIMIDEKTDIYVTSKSTYKREVPFKEEYFKQTYPDIYDHYSKNVVDMAKLKKEQPKIYADVALPKVPTENRSWKMKVYERKVKC